MDGKSIRATVSTAATNPVSVQQYVGLPQTPTTPLKIAMVDGPIPYTVDDAVNNASGTRSQSSCLYHAAAFGCLALRCHRYLARPECSASSGSLCGYAALQAW